MSLIDREQAINLLWKTLFDFEDENEKEFSEEWYLKIRPQVQNISDLSRQAILNMPSAEKTGKWLDTTKEIGWPRWTCSACGGDGRGDYMFCPWCGARIVSIGTEKLADAQGTQA